jgi:hypothetical protein
MIRCSRLLVERESGAWQEEIGLTWLNEQSAGLVEMGDIAFNDPGGAINLLLVEKAAVGGGTFGQVTLPEAKSGCSICADASREAIGSGEA